MSAEHEAGFKGGFRQSMAWLHTWAGLVVGWLLYAVFLTGTLSFFQDEITVWMQPELHGSQPDAATAERALARMQQLGAGADRWTLTLPGARDPSVAVVWRMPGAPPGREGQSRAVVDAGSGELLQPRDTRGGSFLYHFHFELYGMPRLWARWIVGAAAMVMLLAMVSGTITHKKIFKDFFTFRPAKGPRSWLDAHNALAVTALPFHLIMTYSGLLLLMTQLMPWAALAVYDGDLAAFNAELRGRPVNTMPAAGAERGKQRGADQQAGRDAGVHAGGPASGGGDRPRQAAAPAPPLAPLAPMLAEAQTRWGADAVGSLQISHPGRADATVELRARHGDSLVDRGVADRLLFDGVSGALREAPQGPPIAATRGVYNSLTSLHMLQFARPALRWMFVVSGLLGTAMIASGLVLWVVKRAPKAGTQGSIPLGHRLVEVLNVGAVAGLPLAIAGYLWANRLLPLALEQRADWEIRVFFAVWAVAAVHPLLRRHRQAWVEQLSAAAVAFALLVAVDPWLGGSQPLQAVLQGQWLLAGFALSLLAIAAGLAYAAWRLARDLPPPARRRSPGVGVAAGTLVSDVEPGR